MKLLGMTFPPVQPDGSLDTNTAGKIIALVLTVGVFLFLAVAATVAAVAQLGWHLVLEPTAGWLTVLEYALTFLAGMLGIAGIVTGAKWFARAKSGADPAQPPATEGGGVSPSASLLSPLAGKPEGWDRGKPQSIGAQLGSMIREPRPVVTNHDEGVI